MWFRKGTIPRYACKHERTNCISRYCKVSLLVVRHMCHGHPTLNRNPYNWYVKPYYWVDDHPLLYGNNGSLDPSTYGFPMVFWSHFQDTKRVPHKKTPINPNKALLQEKSLKVTIHTVDGTNPGPVEGTAVYPIIYTVWF